jgi:polysaccharide export outer membrane protein
MGLSRLLVVVSTVCCLVAGCAPDAANVTSNDVIPGGFPVGAPHTLAPNDEVEIRFRFYPDLNDRVVVGPDGHLSLQLVDDVTVAGLTVPEASKLLNQRYAAIIKDPQVSVTMRTYAPQEVYVDGWVNNPGVVRSDLPLTLSRALAQAGGAKTGAHTDHILIARRAPDGSAHYYEATLGNYAGAQNPTQDPMLQTYDVVYVPQTAIMATADFVSTMVKGLPLYFNYTLGSSSSSTTITTH